MRLWTFAVLALAALALMAQQASATVTLNISSNPVSYGQNDKITAAAFPTSDDVQIYINSTLVSNPKTSSASYTVCGNGICLEAGTYAVTAKDTTDGTSVVKNLVVEPVMPTFSIQSQNTSFGHSDKITASPAFYNDTLYIYIDNSQVQKGHDVVTYNICTPGSFSCLVNGTHSIGVFDKSEGVWATPNKTLVVTPVPPTMSVQYSKIAYGSDDNLISTAALSTDQVSIIVDNSSLGNAQGSYSYDMCSSSKQICLKPGIYQVYAYDNYERVRSQVYTLNITTVLPQVSITLLQTSYSTPDKITAKAPNANDSIYLYIDKTIAAQGTGSVSYTVCSPTEKTPCLSVGTHHVYTYDGTGRIYSPNYTVNITIVRPNISMSTYNSVFGYTAYINGSAPFYNDSLRILINGKGYLNESGTISYQICKTRAMCLAIGTYNVVVDDVSEGVNSMPQTLMVLPYEDNKSTSVSTSIPSTTTYKATSSKSSIYTTTIPESSRGNPDQFYLEVIGFIIVLGLLSLLYRRFRKPHVKTLP